MLTATCRCGPTSPGLYPAVLLYYASCAAFVGLCRQQYYSRWSSVTSGLWQRYACRSTWKPARLQSVMNAAARLVCSARKYEHITPLLRDLHWLPVRERIESLRARLSLSTWYGTTVPANELCRVADIDARRRLRSASTSALVTPSSRRSTIGDRAFFVAAPPIWNSLPSSVTASDTRHLQAPAEDIFLLLHSTN